MTDFSDCERIGPGAPAAEERRRKTLAARAQRAAGERAKVEAYINGGPDPDGDGITVYAPARPEAQAPASSTTKPAPAKVNYIQQDRSQLEGKIAAARRRIAKLRKRGRK